MDDKLKTNISDFPRLVDKWFDTTNTLLSETGIVHDSDLAIIDSNGIDGVNDFDSIPLVTTIDNDLITTTQPQWTTSYQPIEDYIERRANEIAKDKNIQIEKMCDFIMEVMMLPDLPEELKIKAQAILDEQFDSQAIQ